MTQPTLYTSGDYARFFAGAGDGNRNSPSEPYRSNFRRDYSRLIHCPSFRRLVGKTQLFPGIESDFFRNRLTHSIEVAQIAKSVASRLNLEHKDFFAVVGEIDTDLVETAGLAHDLGHAPFGHNGELALDAQMISSGGFEGNAQSLHIVARLEKKVIDDHAGEGVLADGSDKRFGLDLCARTIASLLKYDDEIPVIRMANSKSPWKGYYESESDVVSWTKENVLQGQPCLKKFKVLECYIMDIADDIAYSTYDLEDAFKAGFLTPLEMISARDNIIDAVVDEINKHEKLNITRTEVRGVLLTVFDEMLKDDRLQKKAGKYVDIHEDDLLGYLRRRYRISKDLSELGFARTRLTSDLVGEFINSVDLKPDEGNPPLSVAYLPEDVRLKVEVLKRYAYVALIQSPRLKIAEKRGKEIVADIYKTLVDNRGYQLLPADYKLWYERLKSDAAKYRVISDFVAGMTDRYAVEFYCRLRSENPQTIFKPH